jgi:hypothetical protein
MKLTTVFNYAHDRHDRPDHLILLFWHHELVQRHRQPLMLLYASVQLL